MRRSFILRLLVSYRRFFFRGRRSYAFYGFFDRRFFNLSGPLISLVKLLRIRSTDARFIFSANDFFLNLFRPHGPLLTLLLFFFLHLFGVYVFLRFFHNVITYFLMAYRFFLLLHRNSGLFFLFLRNTSLFART